MTSVPRLHQRAARTATSTRKRERALDALGELERIAFPSRPTAWGYDRKAARRSLVLLAVPPAPHAAEALGILERHRETGPHLLACAHSKNEELAHAGHLVLHALGPDTLQDIREHLCRRSPYDPLALSAVRVHGWLPSDPARHPWFLLLTGRWELYADLDPEGDRLSRIYLSATSTERCLMREGRRHFPGESSSAGPQLAHLLERFDTVVAFNPEPTDRKSRLSYSDWSRGSWSGSYGGSPQRSSGSGGGGGGSYAGTGGSRYVSSLERLGNDDLYHWMQAANAAWLESRDTDRDTD
ncbi:hypothetical protein [Streptomyces albicerus]|uniref:hypothetical protein n=1 Tax=Streptomyces albicerus TaxID=2569859 RepID=UPI00124B2D11|nr:hypothetical protein [Streptomyces albicerus]